ncbi:hypothetical protein [Hyphomonas sp.]|uniref:hypothetical protein n=1 Tax=Hyphomonas sp. TaxID=87 RepID=UPI0032EBB335
MASSKSANLAHRLKHDGEFRMVAKDWTGGFRFLIGDDEEIEVAMAQGEPVEAGLVARDVVTIAGPKAIWDALFQTVPPRFLNDLSIA